jgi:hypothetical protein
MAPKTALLPFAAFVLLAFSLQAASGLIDRGNGLIYDDVLDITWLQNADLFATQEGPHYNNDWVDQVLWIDNLVYAGFNDWRPASMSVSASAGQPWAPWAYAPSIVDCDPTSGTTEAECMDNELGYMYFYNLDGILGRTDFGGDPGHFDSGIDITTPSGITFRNLNTTYYSSTTMQFIFDPLFYDTSFGVWREKWGRTTISSPGRITEGKMGTREKWGRTTISSPGRITVRGALASPQTDASCSSGSGSGLIGTRFDVDFDSDPDAPRQSDAPFET